MNPFSIVARFPLGIYCGHRHGAVLEDIPSPARLHAALVAAAAAGPRGESDDDGRWGPCPADADALEWLQTHPPDAVTIPARAQTSAGAPAVAWRWDGTLTGSRAKPKVSKLSKVGGQEGVAVAGAFVWSWDRSPPEAVAGALVQLCPDVSHLGTSDCPVRLSVTADPSPATHRWDPHAGPFSPAPGADLDVALPGRLAELATAHRAQLPVPSLARDKVRVTERAHSPAPPRARVRSERYTTVAAAAPATPWSTVLLVPLARDRGGRLPAPERVRWAVAAHRALVKLLDRDAPPVLTGHYPTQTERPSNRVALHLLTDDQPVDLPGRARLALAVLLPHAGDPDEAALVADAVSQLRSLHPRGERARVYGPVEQRPGDRFWRDPAPGMCRLWRTDPPAVPDTRGRRDWTFTHAALLSLGFAWQSLLDPADTDGGGRDRALLEAVNDAGAVVLDAGPLRSSRPEDYVHRVNRHAVVRPYRATLHLGELAGPGTVAAIGQARHLGGGLLVPDDHPEDSTLDRGRR